MGRKSGPQTPPIEIQNGRVTEGNMNSPNLDAPCKHCGQALADFLQEMKEHNAEVVCTTCGNPQDGGRPATPQEQGDGHLGTALGHNGNGSKSGRFRAYKN
jgi:hypothetical protein